MNRILAFFVGLIALSCNEQTDHSSKTAYYANGNIRQKITDNNGNKTIFQYFEHGKDTIEIVIREQEDSLQHMMHYFPNGNLRKLGNLNLDTLKTGKWKFFDQDGALKEIQEYRILDGESYLNQQWILNSKGDTIGGNHYEIKMRDTVGSGEANRFHFFLKRPFFSYESNAYILLPRDHEKLEKDFSNQYNIVWDTIFSIGTKYNSYLELGSRNHDILIDAFSKDEGLVSLIGILVEQQKKELDTVDFVTRSIYFDIPYFVLSNGPE